MEEFSVIRNFRITAAERKSYDTKHLSNIYDSNNWRKSQLFPVWKQFNKKADEKAFAEYEKFNKNQTIESDFDKMVKSLPRQNEGSKS